MLSDVQMIGLVVTVLVLWTAWLRWTNRPAARRARLRKSFADLDWMRALLRKHGADLEAAPGVERELAEFELSLIDEAAELGILHEVTNRNEPAGTTAG